MGTPQSGLGTSQKGIGAQSQVKVNVNFHFHGAFPSTKKSELGIDAHHAIERLVRHWPACCSFEQCNVHER
jgi:hypothetical protein